MTDDHADKPPIVMSTERPLDALLPQLQSSRELRDMAVHPRVLEVEVESGFEWLFTCWRDPGGHRALHAQLRPLIEAAVLVELSRPPRDFIRGFRPFKSLRLMLFEPIRGEGAQPAIRAFGFRPTAYAPERYLGRLSALADEAEALGVAIPEHPAEVYVARVGHAGGALGEKLTDIHRMMAERMGDDVWGRTPGGPSRLFAEYARRALGERLEPNLDGLRSLELLLVQQQPEVLRWIPPLLFQALCDFVPVVARTELGVEVAWAECAPDESGMARPPLIRALTRDGAIHVPVGLHVLRWCMMPLATGEQVPSLAEWLVDQFDPTVVARGDRE